MAYTYNGVFKTAPQPAASTPTNQGQFGLIASDPFYMQQSALLTAQANADAARANEQTQRALVDFGEVPTGYTGRGANDVTRGLAADNTTSGLSQLARILKGQADARRNSLNQLGARGMLQSGETGYQLGEVAQTGKNLQYDARLKLLDFLSGIQAAFSQSELQRRLALVDAMQNAYGRQSQNGLNQYRTPLQIPTTQPWGTL